MFEIILFYLPKSIAGFGRFVGVPR